jgi:hypothetical protein
MASSDWTCARTMARSNSKELIGKVTGTISRMSAAVSSAAPSMAMILTMNSGRCSTLRRISAKPAEMASRRAVSEK